MKHIIGFVDKLIAVTGRIPHELKSDQDIKEARTAIKYMTEYSAIIQRFITSSEVKKHLIQLDKSNEFPKLITEIFSEIEKLVSQILDDTDKLTKILDSDPHESVKRNVKETFDSETGEYGITQKTKTAWQQRIGDMGMGVMMSDLNRFEEVLNKLKKIVLLDAEKISDLINHEEHHNNLKLWFGLEKLSPAERKVQESLYWVNILNT